MCIFKNKETITLWNITILDLTKSKQIILGIAYPVFNIN